jgi:hypothetical protein
MNRYRVLHICHQIAIGSKHKVIESYSDPKVVAEEQWDLKSAGVSIRLLIHDGGVSRPALEVFEEAAQTWDQLLRQWGYLEARWYMGDRC